MDSLVADFISKPIKTHFNTWCIVYSVKRYIFQLQPKKILVFPKYEALQLRIRRRKRLFPRGPMFFVLARIYFAKVV